MWLLGFILFPIVFADHRQLKINNYDIDIVENTLTSIRTTEAEPSNQLDLSSLGLQSIAENVFDDLKHLKNLNLANNSLSFELPEFIFVNLTNLEHLSLADNGIASFYDIFVGLDNLKTLNLSNTHFGSLERGEFYGLPKSSNIFVRGNRISYLSIDLFKDRNLERDDKLLQQVQKEEAEAIQKLPEPVKFHIHRQPISQPLDKNLRVKVCIQEGTVKRLDLLRNNETLSNDCREVWLDHMYGELFVNNMNISNFENGWYRLHGLPIVRIEMKLNKITRVTRELLNDLPKEITNVSLSRNKIERLEKGIIENEHLLTLELDDNLISEIEDGALEKTNLMNLNLFGNRLTTTKFAATLPSTLTALSLYGNTIAKVPNNSFAHLNKLQEFLLSANNITEVNSQIFRNLSSLRGLWLDFNPLRKIQPGAFQDLKDLQELTMNWCELENFEKGVFNGLENIRVIEAVHNKLTKITKDSLEGLPQTLGIFDLGKNSIESLKAGTFVNVPKYKLSLEQNKISKIERGSFNLPDLHKLDLSSNLLTEIDGDSFDGLGKLRILLLNDNHIAKIAKGAMKNLNGLYTLDMRNNTIKELKNGAFFGLPKSETFFLLQDTPVQLIQGGLFENV